MRSTFNPAIDYYAVLGIDHNAEKDTIRKAYTKLARQWHPDKWAHASEEEKKSAAEKFNDNLNAYNVLRDDEQRSTYNVSRKDYVDTTASTSAASAEADSSSWSISKFFTSVASVFLYDYSTILNHLTQKDKDAMALGSIKQNEEEFVVTSREISITYIFSRSDQVFKRAAFNTFPEEVLSAGTSIYENANTVITAYFKNKDDAIKSHLQEYNERLRAQLNEPAYTGIEITLDSRDFLFILEFNFKTNINQRKHQIKTTYTFDEKTKGFYYKVQQENQSDTLIPKEHSILNHAVGIFTRHKNIIESQLLISSDPHDHLCQRDIDQWNNRHHIPDSRSTLYSNPRFMNSDDYSYKNKMTVIIPRGIHYHVSYLFDPANKHFHRQLCHEMESFTDESKSETLSQPNLASGQSLLNDALQLINNYEQQMSARIANLNNQQKFKEITIRLKDLNSKSADQLTTLATNAVITLPYYHAKSLIEAAKTTAGRALFFDMDKILDYVHRNKLEGGIAPVALFLDPQNKEIQLIRNITLTILASLTLTTEEAKKTLIEQNKLTKSSLFFKNSEENKAMQKNLDQKIKSITLLVETIRKDIKKSSSTMASATAHASQVKFK